VNHVTQVIEYIRANPTSSLGVAIAVVVVYYLLNRKSRLVRDAEKRIEELHHERADQYKQLRPPR
jgi:hypothetical protein